MTTLLSSQNFLNTNGRTPKSADDAKNRAVEVVRMRNNNEEQHKNTARANFDLEVTRARVYTILRAVDKHIKKGDVEQAEEELQKAKELEPRNLYVLAFEERLSHLKRVNPRTVNNEDSASKGTSAQAADTSSSGQQSGMNTRVKLIEKLIADKKWDIALNYIAHLKKTNPMNKTLLDLEIRLNDLKAEIEQKMDIEVAKQCIVVNEPAQPSQEEDTSEHIFRRIEKLAEQGEFDSARKEILSIKQIDAPQTSVRALEKMLDLLEQKFNAHVKAEKSVQEAELRLQEAENLRLIAVSTPEQESDTRKSTMRSLSVPPTWREKYLETYKRCLMEGWARGTLSQQETESLEVLRERLEISSTEHANLEREIQWRIYLNAIAEGYLFTSLETEKIEQLREQFHIPAEAHLHTLKKTRQEILALVGGYKQILQETKTTALPVV